MHDKTCSKCFESKSATEFERDSRRPDGRMGVCYACRNASRRGKRGDTSAANARYRTRNRDRFLRQRREWEQRNPEKVSAQRAVRNAVRDGRLIKPTVCEMCGKEALLHGHHLDYANALVVDWLCPKCHSAVHRKMGLASDRLTAILDGADQ